MANYFMLGGDGKEYGPVTGEQLRQWIGEGRANTQTQVRSTEGGSWTALGAIPELSAQPAAAPAAQAPASAFSSAFSQSATQPVDSSTQIKRLASILAAGSGWMKFLAVFMFIGSGLDLIGSFGLAIVIIWIPIWMGVVLWSAGSKASLALATGSEADLAQALDKLRFFFKFYGILIIVAMVIVVLAMIAFMFIGVSSLSNLRHPGLNFGQ
jgi:hypothetical protein